LSIARAKCLDNYILVAVEKARENVIFDVKPHIFCGADVNYVIDIASQIAVLLAMLPDRECG